MTLALGMKRMARIVAGRSFPEHWQTRMRDRAIAVVGAVPASTYLGLASALERWDATDRLGSLQSRTLLMAGEHDFTPLAEQRALAKALNAEFKGFKRPKGNPDDLKLIKGIEDVYAKRLTEVGIIKFEQLANLNDDEIAWLDDQLRLRGRFEREDWAGQAVRLMAETTVGEVPAEEEAKA